MWHVHRVQFVKPFGKYTLLEKIGAGGMAEIWRASLDGADGFKKQVVIKLILPQYARSRSFITMFVREAKVASHIQHPNVVQIYELGKEDNRYFIAMEYVDGKDLLAILEHCTQLKRHVPIELCLYIAGEICKGLAEAHQATGDNGRALNIIHRDVSPSNILIGRDGTVKLTDFGVARASLEGQPAGVTGQLQGKLGYMSPEQVTSKPIDLRSDLFSVGVVLFESITHKRLFAGKNDLETLANVRNADVEAHLCQHPDLPDGVVRILRRALASNMDDRYPSAQELEEDIDQYLFDARLRVNRRNVATFVAELFDMDVDRPEPELMNVSAWNENSNAAEEASWAASELTVPSSPAAGAGLERSSFRFKTNTGDIFGPVTFPNLLNLLHAHSVSPNELVSINETEWRPLHEVTTLAQLVEDAFAISQQMEPTEQGSFGLQISAKLFSRVALEKVTGRFELTGAGRRKEVFFRRGSLVNVLSNFKEELLGTLLLEREIVDEETLQLAMNKARDSGWPLGGALVQMGFLQQLQLFQLLDEQFQDKFHEIFSWFDGTFAFYEGDEPAPDVIPFRLDTLSAVTEGVRKYGSLDLLRNYVGSMASKRMSPVDQRPFDVAQLKLNSREYRYRNLIEASSGTVTEFLEKYASGKEEEILALRVFYLLHQTGHIIAQ